jgi:transcriptional regulator with XRE-family HTH domain
MITRIREVRRARGMTLDDVAQACVPPTTPQTIGRLETGTRTVSVGWLNRIAQALGVDAADLVDHPDRGELPVVAILGANGAIAPKRQALVVPPRPSAGQIAMTVSASIGDYRQATRSGASGCSRGLWQRPQPRHTRPAAGGPLPVWQADRP